MAAKLSEDGVRKLLVTERRRWARELAQRVKAELRGENDSDASLDGKLGEAIAEESGSYSLEFCDPEDVAAGIAKWIVANV